MLKIHTYFKVSLLLDILKFIMQCVIQNKRANQPTQR